MTLLEQVLVDLEKIPPGEFPEIPDFLLRDPNEKLRRARRRIIALIKGHGTLPILPIEPWEMPEW